MTYSRRTQVQRNILEPAGIRHSHTSRFGSRSSRDISSSAKLTRKKRAAALAHSAFVVVARRGGAAARATCAQPARHAGRRAGARGGAVCRPAAAVVGGVDGGHCNPDERWSVAQSNSRLSAWHLGRFDLRRRRVRRHPSDQRARAAHGADHCGCAARSAGRYSTQHECFADYLPSSFSWCHP